MDQDTKDRIIKLWNSGLSSSQVAQEAGVTRGSVMGVLYRARKKGVRVESRPDAKRLIVLKKAVEKKIVIKPRFVAKEAPMPMPVAAYKETEGKPFLDLDAGDCRFPLNSGKPKDFRFCGQPAISGSWVCEHHKRLVYIPIREYVRNEKRKNSDRHAGRA